ncbi:ABC transporter substrate-binding protein [Pseudochelatococcus sp. B33]
MISRRSILKGAGAAGVIAAFDGLPAWAQARRSLNILAVPVHVEMMQRGPGGDIASDWAAANNASVEWLSFANSALAERLFRELSLKSTGIGTSFFFDPWASENILALLEPLEPHMERAPIEDFDDFFPGPMRTLMYEGQLRGIPIRQNIAGLHYNEVFFEERGISQPPSTMEELLDCAKRLTYTRADGTPVAGLVFPSKQSNYTHVVRSWNADYIDENHVVRAAEPPMIAALSALHDLYQAGALPRQFSTLSDEDSVNWLQTGRAAMTITTMSRHAPHNDPAKSLFPGRIKVAAAPSIAALKDEFPVAPVGLNFWSLVVPRAAQNKELAWEFIRYVASPEGTRRLAENGNSPMRMSTYSDPTYMNNVPYAAIEKQVLEYARVALPPFQGSARAADLIGEESEAAVIGVKSPQEAMESLANSLKRLLPS